MSNRDQCRARLRLRVSERISRENATISVRMSRKLDPSHTKTTEFEVEGIEEAYAPARSSAKAGADKLEVEKPPELRGAPVEHTARIWILERRARGWIAKIRRWLVGKSRR